MKLLRGLLRMMGAAAAVVALLAALNWLPSLVQKNFVRQFSNIEDARRAAGFDNVLVPAYFPEGISWPPSFIVAQKRPYQALVAEFRENVSGKTALVIIQSALPGAERQLQRIRISQVNEQTEYWLKGRPAILRIGTCDNGMQCSALIWQERSVYCSVLFASSPFELIKIAESMVR